MPEEFEFVDSEEDASMLGNVTVYFEAWSDLKYPISVQHHQNGLLSGANCHGLERNFRPDQFYQVFILRAVGVARNPLDQESVSLWTRPFTGMGRRHVVQTQRILYESISRCIRSHQRPIRN